MIDYLLCFACIVVEIMILNNLFQIALRYKKIFLCAILFFILRLFHVELWISLILFCLNYFVYSYIYCLKLNLKLLNGFYLFYILLAYIDLGLAGFGNMIAIALFLRICLYWYTAKKHTIEFYFSKLQLKHMLFINLFLIIIFLKRW